MVTGEDETPQRSAWLTNSLSLVAVYMLGVAAWFVSREVMGADPGGSDDGEAGAGGQDDGRGGALMAVGLALGYTSAVCYLCARIPQIIKNYKEKSTEGMRCLGSDRSYTGMLTCLARRSRPALLPALPDRQPHLRREPDRLLAGGSLSRQDSPLAARLPGHNRRGRHHLRAVQAVHTQEGDQVSSQWCRGERKRCLAVACLRGLG